MTESEIKFSSEIAKQYGKNCRIKTSTRQEKNNFNKISNTAIVNRKQNYKLCNICKKLVLNISCHVQETHKIKRTEQNYSDHIQKSVTVPACFTKKVGTEVQILTDKEIQEIKDENMIINMQEEKLKDLAKSRKLIQSASDDAEREKLAQEYHGKKLKNWLKKPQISF